MERLLIFVIVFVYWVSGFAQVTYNYKDAERVLTEEFFKDTFWMMPTDENDVCYFRKKSEAKKSAQIRAIPVLNLIDGLAGLDFEPDYSIHVGLLFNQNSFLCPLFVNTCVNKQGKLKRYMSIGWNPSPGFIKHYLANSSDWFYISSITDFVLVKGSRCYVWSEEKSSLEDYTENLIAYVLGKKDEARVKFTGLDTLGVENVTEYRINRIQSDTQTIVILQSKDETIQIGPVTLVSNTKDGMNRIAIEFENENYFIEMHPGKEWLSITTNEYEPFATYINAPYTSSGNSELSFNKLKDYSKRLVEVNVNNNLRQGILEFIPVRSKEVLLTGQLIKKQSEDYFVIRERVQNKVNPKILRLCAIVIFWSENLIVN